MAHRPLNPAPPEHWASRLRGGDRLRWTKQAASGISPERVVTIQLCEGGLGTEWGLGEVAVDWPWISILTTDGDAVAGPIEEFEKIAPAHESEVG